MQERKAVLIVSFGTSHLDTLKKNIAAIEREIAAAMPDYRPVRAFTSGVIMDKLEKRDGIKIPNVQEALACLDREGYTRVVVQPTHIINGEEFDKLCRMTEPYRQRLEISIGKPLLTTVEDYRNLVKAVMESMEPPEEGEAIIFMGHGSPHYANAAYALFEYMLHDFGWDRSYVGTVEGYPELEQVMCRIRLRPEIRKIRLHPLMVVAGDHAKNDMSGPEADSWYNRLSEAGYEVQCVLRGLGEYESVRRLFAEHACHAEKLNG